MCSQKKNIQYFAAVALFALLQTFLMLVGFDVINISEKIVNTAFGFYILSAVSLSFLYMRPVNSLV
jgi:purine-cytosine permease-like protein